MSPVVLVETTRGQTSECQHYGSIAVVNAHGDLTHFAGDPNHLTFSRSTIKPFQALPFLNAGGVEHFGLSQAQIALLCSSHSGEDSHLKIARSIFTKTEVPISKLQCGCHVPLYFSTTNAPPAPGNAQWSDLHNNCSGKHAGFLAYCKQHALDLDTYLSPSHPLQAAIREQLREVCEVQDLPMGIDGCSAPNYALPLRALALSYAKLATRSESVSPLNTLFNAMTAHPELVSGTNRNDLAFTQAGTGNWVAKIGADGVQLIGVRGKKDSRATGGRAASTIGIAIKITDGNWRALIAAAVETLRQLDLLQLSDAQLQGSALGAWARPQLKNARGLVIGEVRPVFKLQS
jgi:L-asparaginase II